MFDRIFRPIRNHLRKVSTVTKENYPNKVERAQELRKIIRTIGDFIKTTLEAESAQFLEDRLWTYVADKYWPNKGVEHAQLKSMYGKVVQADQNVVTAKRLPPNPSLPPKPPSLPPKPPV